MLLLPRRPSATLALGLALLSGCGRQAPAPAPAHLYGGTASGQTPAVAPHGKYWVDVQNDARYSALLKVQLALGANGNCSPVIQQACDDLAPIVAASTNAGVPSLGVVFLRAGIYGMAQGIDLDKANIELRGEGGATLLVTNPGLAIDLIRVGFPRTGSASGYNVALDSTYRPDCFGVMGTAFAPSAGLRHGIRTNGQAFLNFQAHPYALGKYSVTNAGAKTSDYWMESRAFCLDFAVQMNGGVPFPAGYMILGAGDLGRNNVQPFTVDTPGSNQFRFAVGTQATPFATPTLTTTTVTLSGTGLQRITFQASMDDGQMAIWVNGVQVATASIPTTGFLNENKYYPYLINGGTGTDRGPWGATNLPDFTLFGHCLSSAKVYTVGANNSSQVRIDGTGNNDGNRYNPVVSGTATTQPNVMGCLPLNEDITLNSRELTTNSGTVGGNGLTTHGYICHQNQINQAGNALAYIRVTDLRLQGNWTYGQGIAVAGPLHGYIENVSAIHLANGVGAINFTASYNTRINKCNFDVTDNAIYGFQNSLFVTDCNVNTAGRTSIRTAGCVTDISLLNTAFAGGQAQHCIAHHASAYGGAHVARSVTTDFEGNSYGRSAFYYEASPYTGRPFFRLEAVNLGTVGNVPVFEIADGPAGGYSSFTVDGATFGTPSVVLQSNAKLVDGTIKNVSYKSYGSNIDATRFASPAGVPARFVLEETTWTAPPRLSLAWTQGAHRLIVPTPAPGQFREWRCVGSGTGDAASWAGSDPLLTSPADLAAYLKNSSGNFAGTGSPATIYVGLGTGPASSISPTEPTGGGYARVAYTNSSGNWTTNLDGSKDNTNAIAFPTLSADLTVKSVLIYGNASGGTPLFAGDLPGTQTGQPRVLPSGSTPTFAPGALLSY